MKTLISNQKSFLVLFTAGVLFSSFTPSLAKATSGWDCKSIDGTLQVFTENAISEDDKVLSIGVIAPWISKSTLTFVDSLKQTGTAQEIAQAYMGANENGQAITLVLGEKNDKNIYSAMAYLLNDGIVTVDQMACTNSSF